MNKARLTRLPVEVNVDTKRLNWLKVNIDAADNYNVRLLGCTKYQIEGGGYFTNSSYTDNQGQDKTTDGTTTVYFKVTTTAILWVYNIMDATFIRLAQTTNTKSKHLIYQLADVLENKTQLTQLELGVQGEAIKGNGNACKGNVGDMVFNTQKLYLSGCDKLSGSMDNVIINQCTENNLNVITMHGTNLTLHTESLEGKNSLGIVVSTSTYGDIKYFGDTRNRRLNTSTSSRANFTGSIENFVTRAIARGRTGQDDSFFFQINGGGWNNVTYNGVSVNALETEYMNEHPEHTGDLFVVFEWDAESNITYTFSTSNPSDPFIPLPD